MKIVSSLILLSVVAHTSIVVWHIGVVVVSCTFSSTVLVRTHIYLPARASEQGNVIGLVSVYIYMYNFFL